MAIRVRSYAGDWAAVKAELEVTLYSVTDLDTFKIDYELDLIDNPVAMLTQVFTSVGAVTFAGSGLDDATSGGTYSGSEDAAFEVVIDDDASTPESFKWRKVIGGVAGAWTEGVDITTSAQTLEEGVTITFAANVGHTNTESWTILVMADVV